jgi:hypothetical protein
MWFLSVPLRSNPRRINRCRTNHSGTSNRRSRRSLAICFRSGRPRRAACPSCSTGRRAFRRGTRDARLDDRVDRTGFLAEAAEDALRQVDVVARRAACAVVALIRFDRDRHGRAHRLAQLAGDAAFFAVRIATQRMQAAKARALRRLLFRKLDRDLAREQVAAGQRHALHQFDQHQTAEQISAVEPMTRPLTSRSTAETSSSRR